MGSRIRVGSTADIFVLTHCKWICNLPVDLNCVYCHNHVCMLLGQHMHTTSVWSVAVFFFFFQIVSHILEAQSHPYTLLSKKISGVSLGNFCPLQSINTIHLLHLHVPNTQSLDVLMYPGT